MQSEALEEFLTSLHDASGLAQSWTSVSRFFEALGLDRIIYLDLAPHRERSITTMPEAWAHHYVEHNHVRIDPFMRYCAATTQQFGTGIDYLEDHPYLDACERDFVRQASETGFRSGITCMVRFKDPEQTAGAAGWNFGSTMRRDELEKMLSEQGAVIKLAAHFAHEKLARAEAPLLPDAVALSASETECLQWLACGLRTKQIAARMDIRPVTVELHLRNARTKLGAQTREQALARAVLLGKVKL